MSIYGTILDLEDGEYGPPYAYQGSHILPAEEDLQDGTVQLAAIPSHITRDGRDDRPEDGAPWPWLRLSVNASDAVLHARQVRKVWESMGAWLAQVEERAAEPDAPMKPSRRRNRLTREHLKSVADVYLAALAAGWGPTRSVADHFDVPHSTAAKWVGRARRQGVLPPVAEEGAR